MNATNAAAITAASNPTAAATSVPKSGKPQRRMARPPMEGVAAVLPPTATLPTSQRASSPATGSKTAAVIALLQREGGATLAELVAATDWLPHTTRAALTGLRKKGHAIARSKRGEETHAEPSRLAIEFGNVDVMPVASATHVER